MEPIKVYPTVEELNKTGITAIHCPEQGCVSVFKSDSNLNLHLAKTHKKADVLKRESVQREYHCPEMKCVYHKTKYFKSFKLLKQHYLKVHTEKMFECCSCNMKFPTVTARNFHLNYCGVSFSCCNCNASYPSYESLMTHGRRKNHIILEKSAYKCIDPIQKSSSTTLLNDDKNTISLVKSSSLHDMNSISKNTITIERSSQTDIYSKTRQFKSRQVNQQETQTHNNKCLLTAETQTIGDYNRNVKLEPTSSNEDFFERKDSKTQTHPVDSTTKSCNTSFNLDDFSFSYEQSNSGTQTTAVMPSDCDLFLMQTEPFAAQIGSEFMHSSSQTSFHEDSFDSENYFNCSAETQTDFMLILDQDYSNMCTQTGDEVFNVFNEFNSSHTQTVFEDVLRSVESQTMMSTHNNKHVLSCRDMAHMETQTDEFKQMLEEINA
ncbi:uncharacterized protein [Onthophagus taurus]|uniref:uncharacterized protein n=1 Tax=Onthophagus taurus TaxID=166361 RepID=UPI000C207C32|nr:protein indeterminate-domain 9 [Onthophagus taurus]